MAGDIIQQFVRHTEAKAFAASQVRTSLNGAVLDRFSPSPQCGPLAHCLNRQAGSCIGHRNVAVDRHSSISRKEDCTDLDAPKLGKGTLRIGERHTVHRAKFRPGATGHWKLRFPLFLLT